MLACLILILAIPDFHFQSARSYIGQHNSETIKRPWTQGHIFPHQNCQRMWLNRTSFTCVYFSADTGAKTHKEEIEKYKADSFTCRNAEFSVYIQISGELVSLNYQKSFKIRGSQNGLG